MKSNKLTSSPCTHGYLGTLFNSGNSQNAAINKDGISRILAMLANEGVLGSKVQRV